MFPSDDLDPQAVKELEQLALMSLKTQDAPRQAGAVKAWRSWIHVGAGAKGKGKGNAKRFREQKKRT